MAKKEKTEEEVIDFAPAGKSSKSRLVWVFYVVFLVSIILGIVGLGTYFEQRFSGLEQKVTIPQENDKTEEALQQLIQRLDGLESSVEELHEGQEEAEEEEETEIEKVEEKEINLPPELPDEGAEKQSNSLSSSRDLIAGSRAKEEDKKLDPVVKPQDDRGKSESGPKQDTTAVLIIAVVNLRDHVRGVDPFYQELDLVKTLGREDPVVMRHVKALEDYARSGVADSKILLKDFREMARLVVQAALKPAKDAGLLEQASYSFSKLVTIRKVGGSVEGDSVEALLAKAEEALREEDVEMAVAHISALEGEPADMASDWLTQAIERVVVEEHIAALYTHIIERAMGVAVPEEGAP